jgi:hypothetical protein
MKNRVPASSLKGFQCVPEISDKPISSGNENSYAMDARLLDVVIGVTAFIILCILLAVLPMVMMPAYAYLGAIIVFIIFLSGAGYLVNDKIT